MTKFSTNLIAFGLTLAGLSAVACGASSTQPASGFSSVDGAVLYLDAAHESSKVKGHENSSVDAPRESNRSRITNLAQGMNSKPQSSPSLVAFLHGCNFDGTCGWVGSGSAGDPFALRFDASSSYVESDVQIELPELTLEAWAYVEGVGNAPRSGTNARGATLIGNDFGQGGVALLIARNGSPMLLTGTQFVPVAADTPLNHWQQVAASFTRDKARVFVNGELVSTVTIQRTPQKDHLPKCMLGAARHPSNDFVEADGLRGMIAITRVYDRALTVAEVRRNFELDRGRFNIQSDASDEPIRATAAPPLPGLPALPVRNCKWDYVEHPPLISGSGPAGWPSNARQAFDGYPSRIDQPYLRNCWRCEVKPDIPAEVTINYRRPVAITRFVHWFCEPAAWKSAEILTSADGETWESLQKFDDLPHDYPQYLPIDKPILARQYKIIVRALAPTAGTQLVTHEIETNYGPTIGSIITSPSPTIQSEPARLAVLLVNGDGTIHADRVRLGLPAITGDSAAEQKLAETPSNRPTTVSFDFKPQEAGIQKARIDLLSGDSVIDSRTFSIGIAPKLVFSQVVPKGPIMFDCRSPEASGIPLKGVLTNRGSQPATGVKVSWTIRHGSESNPLPPIILGDLNPGESAPFEWPSARPRRSRSLLAQADGGILTELQLLPTISVMKDWGGTATTSAALFRWETGSGPLHMEFHTPDETGVALTSLAVWEADRAWLIANGGPTNQPFMSATSDSVFSARLQGSKTNDLSFACRVSRVRVDPLQPAFSDLKLRLKVEKPKIMFRPHIDWYTVEHGPNFPQLANAHNSATRMLCIQTADDVTLTIVPDTDNLTWGFTKDNEISLKLHVPDSASDYPLTTRPAQTQPWRPITDTPARFNLTFAVRKGDWWDAYRHVVQDIFKFEQPRQWTMPMTQMQMLTARYSLRPEVWSEKWQVVRSHPGFDFFYNFYGLTYNIPALYSWYLVSNDKSALDRAQKDVEFLLKMQEKEGYADGAWFSMYCVEGSPSKLVGRDQAFNRWLMPHATGTTAKTLLWYWEASGKSDTRVFAAARRGCDWLLKTQRTDGAWTYAFDLQGKPVSQLSGAGQIWCTWALWKMYQYTGEQKYADAARRSRDAFKKTFMDVHRYEGYWEDVSGAGGKVARSWEGYEPAIACLVFADMGDKELAIEAGKDTATWSWTRVTSTRQYETAYGQTTEQSLCGPSQAQSPMIGVGLHQIYELTGDKLWSDFSGAIKAINFAADPDQAYGMVATGGWDDPLTGVIGPPYENTRPMVTPNNSRGDEYGRQVWNNWCTDQFAWLALEWLVREANLRAPQYVKIDPNTYRGVVLGTPGRVKMPEEKCDVQGLDHIDINWVGYQNDDRYMLLIMNHYLKTAVMVRPHYAHLGVPSVAPQLLIGSAGKFEPTTLDPQTSLHSTVGASAHYQIEIPENGTALLIWDRLK